LSREVIITNCIVRPIPLVKYRHPHLRPTSRLSCSQLIPKICYVWYIEGTRENILVDAGSDAEHFSKRGVPGQDIQSLKSGLNKVGTSVDDIDLVILTHLHPDHVVKARCFPKARFLIQKDELDFARNPHPAASGFYLREFFDGLDFEIISGDAKICEEVSVFRTPGHTPGGQSVSIKTAQGIVVISGICTTRDNFEPTQPLIKTAPVIPPGLFISLFDVYGSLLKIKEIADIVIANHDAAYEQISSVP